MSAEVEEARRRARVADALESRSPRLAGMYRFALATVDAKTDESGEAARVSVICHCMRELMMNLPAAMAENLISRPDPSFGSLVGKLPKMLTDHPELDLDADLDLVPVPREVARALSRVVATATKEEGRNQKNAAALLNGGSNPSHPALRQWKATYGFFVGWAHLDKNHERGGKLPSGEEIVTAIRVVEDIVVVRSTEFFGNVRSIEALLEEINAESEEDG